MPSHTTNGFKENTGKHARHPCEFCDAVSATGQACFNKARSFQRGLPRLQRGLPQPLQVPTGCGEPAQWPNQAEGGLHQRADTASAPTVHSPASPGSTFHCGSSCSPHFTNEDDGVKCMSRAITPEREGLGVRTHMCLDGRVLSVMARFLLQEK